MPLRKKVLFLSFSLFFPSSFLLPPLFSLFFPSSPFFSPFSPHPSFSFYFLLLPYCCFSSFSFLYVHSFLLSFHVFSLLPFSSLHQSIHLIYLMSFFTFPSFSAKLVCICITLISYSITNSPIFSVELTLHPSFSLFIFLNIVAEAALLAGVVAFSQHAVNVAKTATDFVRDSEHIGRIIRKQFLEMEERYKNNPWDSEVEPDENAIGMVTPEPIRRHFHRRKSSLQDLMVDEFPSPAPATRPRSASLTSINEKEALQQVLDSQVTVRGKNMSGGLAQSVALARVYVRPK